MYHTICMIYHYWRYSPLYHTKALHWHITIPHIYGIQSSRAHIPYYSIHSRDWTLRFRRSRSIYYYTYITAQCTMSYNCSSIYSRDRTPWSRHRGRLLTGDHGRAAPPAWDSLSDLADIHNNIDDHSHCDDDIYHNHHDTHPQQRWGYSQQQCQYSQ